MHILPVTCLAATEDGHRQVSGSLDGSVGVWFNCSALLRDLHCLVLIKQLPTRGNVTIVSVNINSLNGNILAAAGSDWDLFSCNGTLLVTVNITSPDICLSPPPARALGPGGPGHFGWERWFFVGGLL